MFQRHSFFRLFVAVCLLCVLFPNPVQAELSVPSCPISDPGDQSPLTVDEQRQILGFLDELAAARAEIDALKAQIANDEKTQAALQNQIAAMDRLIQIYERMIAAMGKAQEYQAKVVDQYEKMVAAAQVAQQKAEERADRAEKLLWMGPLALLLGVAIGFFTHGLVH